MAAEKVFVPLRHYNIRTVPEQALRRALGNR